MHCGCCNPNPLLSILGQHHAWLFAFILFYLLLKFVFIVCDLEMFVKFLINSMWSTLHIKMSTRISDWSLDDWSKLFSARSVQMYMALILCGQLIQLEFVSNSIFPVVVFIRFITFLCLHVLNRELKSCPTWY